MSLDEIIDKEEEYYKQLRKYGKIIAENRNNYSLLSSTMNEIYRFLRNIAPVFYCIEDYLDASELYHSLTTEVKHIESYLDEHFIILSEPNFTYQEKNPQKPKTNNYSDLLDWIVYMARVEYAYTNFWTKRTSIDGLSFENKCVDMSKKIASICSLYGIDCVIKRINPGFEPTARLHNGTDYHDVCIITLNNEYFLVDCTYRQFFMLKWNSLERIGIPFLSNAKPGIFMTLNDNRMSLADKLLKRGWIHLSKDNIKNYFDGFALSYRNGFYYDETNDYSFITNYTSSDYVNFLEGKDSQVKHEGERVLKLQKGMSKYHI